MPTELVPRKFDQACVPLLGNFDCGKDRFGQIATKWIRCVDESDCALQAISERGTEVYLYNTPAGELVGFGSLGKTTRNVKKVQETWSIIPHVGIDFPLRGKPKTGQWEDRYGASIMRDLMALARDHNTPTLMLKVHEENHAKRLYYDLGFRTLCGPNDEGYLTMTIQNHD